MAAAVARRRVRAPLAARTQARQVLSAAEHRQALRGGPRGAARHSRRDARGAAEIAGDRRSRKRPRDAESARRRAPSGYRRGLCGHLDPDRHRRAAARAGHRVLDGRRGGRRGTAPRAARQRGRRRLPVPDDRYARASRAHARRRHLARDRSADAGPSVHRGRRRARDSRRAGERLEQLGQAARAAARKRSRSPQRCAGRRSGGARRVVATVGRRRYITHGARHPGHAMQAGHPPCRLHSDNPTVDR